MFRACSKKQSYTSLLWKLGTGFKNMENWRNNSLNSCVAKIYGKIIVQMSLYTFCLFFKKDLLHSYAMREISLGESGSQMSQSILIQVLDKF